MEQKHTPEPWALDKEIDGIYADSITWVKGGWGLVCKTTNQTRCNFTPENDVCEANAQRIVDCVNEFAGVPDVVGFMEKVRNNLEILLIRNQPEHHTPLSQGNNRVLIEEALALFPKEQSE